jgi:hypothetical protein
VVGGYYEKTTDHTTDKIRFLRLQIPAWQPDNRRFSDKAVAMSEKDQEEKQLGSLESRLHSIRRRVHLLSAIKRNCDKNWEANRIVGASTTSENLCIINEC